MASNGPSPHFPALHLSVPTPQPSRSHYAQSLLGPSFHDPRTHHVFKSHHERRQSAPLSRHDDERRHAIGSHSTLALHLYLAACNSSSICCFLSLEKRSWVIRCGAQQGLGVMAFQWLVIGKARAKGRGEGPSLAITVFF